MRRIYFQDPQTDGVVPFAIQDVATAARLAEKMTQFDLLSTPGIAQDISQQNADLHTTLQMVANTIKPLVVLVSEHKHFGPGGNFLMSGSTCRLFRQMPYESRIWPSMTLNQWQTKGSVAAEATLRRHVTQVRDGLEPPADHDELMDRGRRFIDTLGQ
ncbi:MAG: hypothetical protein KFF68_00255 [Desulfosarcina sp.]|nr:hypothetical protein [Desulfosarcina sp.]